MRLIHAFIRIQRALEMEMKRRPILGILVFGIFFYTTGRSTPTGFGPLDWFNHSAALFVLLLLLFAYVYQRWGMKTPH